jgi:glutamine---fructose-6-phosphate transaminase (isomerizing)
MSATSREIASQPALWAKALSLAAEVGGTLAAPDERVLAVGCGTSAFVAQCYATLRERAGFGETDAAYASELPAGRRYDRVVAVTRSGTTIEVLDALRALPAGTTRVAVTAVGGQPVDGLVDERILLDFADEASVVQTRFPTTLLALARGALGDDVGRLVRDGQAAVDEALPVDPAGFGHFVFLGTGWTIGLAHEGALKLREAAQAWSESYPAMDYRHGPIAVAGPRSLVWMLGRPPAGLAGAVASTEATVHSDRLDPLAQLILVQRLALGLAAARGLDPDRPRHLARSVVLAPTPHPPRPGGHDNRSPSDPPP